MSVQLMPSSQLGFQRPLTTLVKRTLSVSNHNSQAIAYKVKTTAPKQYCVRPNSGRIEPGETVEVQVLLQPMKEDPPAGTKCRDKFLVQSVVITPERENIPLTELWGVVEKDKDSANGVDQIHEQKIRCTYLPAADEPVNQSIPEEQSTSSKAADTTLNPDSSFVSTINSTSPSSPPSRLSSAPSGLPALGQPTSTLQPRQVVDSSSSPSASSSLPTSTQNSQPSAPAAANAYVETAKEKASSAATLASATLASAATTAASGLSSVAKQIDPNATLNSRSIGPTSGGSGGEVEKLRQELSAAQSEISRLKSELASSGTSGLRQRGLGQTSKEAVESGERGNSKVVEMSGAEGVPVQTVAAIAFAVFLFTWSVTNSTPLTVIAQRN
ncbi:hypothetical protein JCM3765_002267 [Sporobolomyces pararoseus]